MSGQQLYEASVAAANAGRLDEALALARQAALAEPGLVEAHAQMGALLAALRRPDEAVDALQRALAIEPDRPDVLNNLGAIWRVRGHIERARAAFARAIEIDPTYADAILNLAGTLRSMDRTDEAITVLRRAGAGATAQVVNELGNVLWKMGRNDEAIVEFRRALASNANHADAWLNLGCVQMEQGDLRAAASSFLSAIVAAPGRAEYYIRLAQADPGAITDEHLAAVEAIERSQAPDVESDVHFALGKLYALRGDRKNSFEHIVEANIRVRSTLTYDEPAAIGAFDEIARTFDADYLRVHRNTGCASTSPVFVFGMPRSGTTLVEQILASHPDVYGAGELRVFGQVAADVLGAKPASLRELGERYVRDVVKVHPDAASALRVTDKMPENLQYAGLIHLALPNARMIHVRRDPIDTCLSCFSASFADADGLAWTYDLAELGRYYNAYLRLMEHWRAVLPPAAMLEVRYEAIVDDVETQARRLIEYCDLPWDDRCLEFYSARRPVKTASVAEVRRPIYRSSMNAARAYGEIVQPLIAALKARGPRE